VYRGNHYKSSLNHKVASHSSADLNYRGISHHVWIGSWYRNLPSIKRTCL